MDQTVCYGSDEEENDSDMTFSESTDEETDNNLNDLFQQAIQQGPSQQGPSQQGPTQQGPTHVNIKPNQKTGCQINKKNWKFLKLKVTLTVKEIHIFFQTQKVTTYFVAQNLSYCVLLLLSK